MKNPIKTVITSFIIFSSMIAGANPSQSIITNNIASLKQCLGMNPCQYTPTQIINGDYITSHIQVPIITAPASLVRSGWIEGYNTYVPYSKSSQFALSRDNNRHFNTIGVANHTRQNLEIIIQSLESFTSPKLNFYAKITVPPNSRNFIKFKELNNPYKVFFNFSEAVSGNDVTVYFGGL